MRRQLAALALLSALSLPAAAQEPDGPVVSAEEMIGVFTEVCLDALPDFATAGARLEERGFGEADAAGFRLHDSQPLAAMALPAEDAEPPAAPACMVIGAHAEFADARAALESALEGRGSDLRSLHSTAVDVDHRIWLWREDDRELQLVLAEDGNDNLSAIVSVLPEESG